MVPAPASLFLVVDFTEEILVGPEVVALDHIGILPGPQCECSRTRDVDLTAHGQVWCDLRVLGMHLAFRAGGRVGKDDVVALTGDGADPDAVLKSLALAELAVFIDDRALLSGLVDDTGPDMCLYLAVA